MVKHRSIWQTSGLIAMQQAQSDAAETRSRPAESVPVTQAGGPQPVPAKTPPPREIGGRDGPEPTRFGDWEKNGRCIDF